MQYNHGAAFTFSEQSTQQVLGKSKSYFSEI